MCIHIWEALKTLCVPGGSGIISGKLLSPAVLHPRLLITTGAGHVLLLGQTRAGMTSWGTTGLSEHPELTSKTFPALTSPLCSSSMPLERALLALRAGPALKWGLEVGPWDGICRAAGQNQRCDASVIVPEVFTSNETLHTADLGDQGRWI